MSFTCIAILDVGMTRDGVVSRRGFLLAALAAACGCRRPVLTARLARSAGGQGRRAAQGRQVDDPAVDGRRAQPVRHVQSQARLGESRPGAGHQHQSCPACSSPSTGRRRPQVMDKIALIRSMVSSEAEHDRAIALVRTGYPPSPALRYPTWGSVVARDREQFDLRPAVLRAHRQAAHHDARRRRRRAGRALQSVQDRRAGQAAAERRAAACRPTCCGGGWRWPTSSTAEFARPAARRRSPRSSKSTTAPRGCVLSPRIGRVRSGERARQAARRLRPHQLRPGLPAGPAAGRAGRELRRSDQHRLAATRAGTRTSWASSRIRRCATKPIRPTPRC